MSTIKLSALELRTVCMAAESIAEDINEYGLSGPEKAAYSRAIQKLRDARQGQQA